MKRLAHYSQYFLHNPSLVKELIGHTSIGKHDVVYDIGAGSGSLSAALSGRCKAVVAVEAEPRMVVKLRDNMRHYDNVTVHAGDFLDMELPASPYKIFANIPFHLSSPIVRKITQANHPPEAAYLVVQKQFANKLLPDHDGFTGQLGMMIGPEFAVRIRRRLLRSDFSPRPNVDTVLVELVRRPVGLVAHTDMPAYRKFVETCFADPRVFARAPQRAVGLPVGVKPSQMKLAQWVALFHAR